ncbi:MAG: VanZ family protein [Candidatus Woesearchaeota archaeon]
MNKEGIKKSLKNPYFNWGLVVAYAALIFYMSSLPRLIPPSLEGGLIDLIANYSIHIGLAHFIEYAILSLLLFRALYVSKVKNPAVYAVVIAIVYGITDEFHQLFIPNRMFDVIDLFFNTIGAIAVQFIGKIKTWLIVIS